MKLGVFAKTYERSTVEEVFAAAAADGMATVQFNFVSAGLASMPDAIDRDVVARVRAAADAHGISIASVSATYNLIHPEIEVRKSGFRRFEVLAAVCHALGAQTLSLCTGTRDSDNMWQHHPSNDQPEAWADLVSEIGKLSLVAERHGLQLGIEPEPGNVISTARRARRLLDEMGSACLGIVLDPANLIDGVAPEHIVGMIDEGVSLLGDVTVIAHGKDRDASGAVQPPGRGVVPWSRFLEALQSRRFTGPLILHGLPGSAVPAAAAYLRSVLAQLPEEEA